MSAAPDRPAGGRYAAECCGGAVYGGYSVVAQLRVAPGGRRLLGGAKRSYIGCDRDGTLLALALRRGVPIRPDGTFAFRGRRRGTAFRLRGRFDRPDSARLVYSLGARAPSFGCVTGPRRLRLHRAAGRPPFTRCATQPGRTLVSDGAGRVFQQRRVYPRRWAFIPFAYGCLYATSTRVPLGWDGSFADGFVGQDLGPFRLAGPYVAYGCGGNLNIERGCWSAVVVVDLRDGSELHRVNLPLELAGVTGRGAGPSGVELHESGSVAWLAGGEPLLGHVAVTDAAGTRVLDEGRDIERGSLDLSGSTLTWRSGGDVRSATLN